ncbi:transcriptional regulator, XRE family with cupin sensor domain protein [Rubellimicrobium mesophilum DSM 19309]|uniref:Transcriptional regulator, XRE family with cupin sensor domain protein n=1 Tax=Rubellimicrobium mesophilum DSM 19309 TaxID=442562 RepID=A0A017HPD3_9RHOB|nr:XRE family transcriptional regulator [Rubellimicrobium mesophilum]EYD76008.1 transcriptional regulator, XRE family with cupin sensor domain protein [Rubellimicrobium mesophilum DSM 19309]
MAGIDSDLRTGPLLGPLLRKRRRKLGLTLRELCARTGLSVGYMSQVENDKAVPTLATLAQIAEGLEVGLDYFVAQPKPADALSRAEGRPRFSLPGSPMVYEAISSDYPGSELSSYILHVPPGFASETVTHEGEEIIVILEGEIEQRLGGVAMTMRAGDSLHYSGATPHAWANHGAPARILWTGTLSVLHRHAGPRLPRRPPEADDTPTGRTDRREKP